MPIPINLSGTGAIVVILCGFIVLLLGAWFWMHWNTAKKEEQIWGGAYIGEATKEHFEAINMVRK